MGGRIISQEAFDALVTENMDDLGMDPDEALQDAIQTLTLQGVDLSGIITCIPGVKNAKENPVIQSLDGLKNIADHLAVSKSDDQRVVTVNKTVDFDELVVLLDKLYDLCSVEESDNASIATRNGGVEILTSLCSLLHVKFEMPLLSALKAMSSLLHDIQSTETFQRTGGPKIVMDILNGSKSSNILDSGFGVIAAASTGNEILKEAFMDLKIDELFIQTMREQTKGSMQNLYHAIRTLLTPDDNRVLASQVYGYARRFAQIGIADALVGTLREGLGSSSLASACSALKALAVNDEICKSISENGGIDAILKCIDDSSEHNDKVIARACCSLLSNLAGSDANKNAIVQKGGLDRLMKLSARFSENPSVLQEIMSIVTVLSLRSPENAARAIESGAGDLAIQAMKKFPASYQMQRQSCRMIRNLVVRNPENRTLFLGYGIEKLIRKAKESHEICKDDATAALRDLGLNDYYA